MVKSGRTASFSIVHLLAGGAAWLMLVNPLLAQQLIRAAPGVNAQLSRLEFRVLGGRIQATNDIPGGRLSFGAKSLGREENLTVDLSSPFPAVDYSVVSRKARVQIVISDGDQLRATCQRQSRNGVAPMRLEQSGSLLLIIESDDEPPGGKEQEYRASTIWHLLLRDPEIAQRHVVPVLQILRPGWPLMAQAKEIEQQLFSMAKGYQPLDWRRLDELVVQLGNEDFGRRQAAERALREIGDVALPYLKVLNSAALDAEQRFRVRRLIGSFSGNDQEDVPMQVARRLLSDPEAWLALLSREEAPKREIAARHLERLLGHKLDFDVDGSRELRMRQIAVLRGQWQAEHEAPKDMASQDSRAME